MSIGALLYAPVYLLAVAGVAHGAHIGAVTETMALATIFAAAKA